MTNVLALHAEAAAIARRRPDSIRDHPAQRVTSQTRPPFAALLHRLAALMTTENLPAARVTVTEDSMILVDCSQSSLVENAVRRWCAALDLGPVTEVATESGGFAAVEWSSSGYGFGPWCHVIGGVLLPTPITDRFGDAAVAE